MNRFMGIVEEPERRLGEWGVDSFERTHVALELDFLGKKGLAERIKIQKSAADEGGAAAGRTSQGICNVEDKTLRSCSQNACTISVMMLSNLNHRRICRAVLASASPLREWHSAQNKQLRSVGGSLAWLTDQTSGGYFDHLVQSFANLERRESLQQSDFVLAAPSSDDQVNDGVVTDDEFADLHGQAAIVLAGLRLRRGLWLLRGWPYSLFRCLGGGDAAQRCADQFMQDARNHESLVNFAQRSASVQKLAKRSIMQLAAVKQFRLAFAETGGRVTEDVTELLRKRGKGIYGTQACEDINNSQRNSKQLRGSQRFRRPPRSMAVALMANVLDERHSYKPILWDLPVHGKRASLKREVFASPASDRSLPFERIVSTATTPAWHSPASFSNCAPVSDLQLLDDAIRLGDIALVEKAWLGCLGEASHRMVWGLRFGGVGEWSWYIPLTHMVDSAVIAWPVRLQQMPGHPETTWVDIRKDVREPAILSVFDLSPGTLKAASFVWKSPIAQRVAYPRSDLPLAIRAVLTEEPQDIRLVAARRAFWSLTKATIQGLAAHWGIRIGEGADLFGTLFATVQGCLGGSDGETMRVVSQRLASQEQALTFSEEMSGIDEVMEVFERPDRASIEQERKKLKEKSSESEAFKAAYREKAERVRSVVEQHAAKERKKRKTAAASSSSSRPVRAPDEFTIAQVDAKSLLPPGASVWRGVARNNWNAHLKPYARTSASWLRSGGEAAALKVVLRTVWSQYLEVEGLSRAACPVEGLWDGE